MESRDQRDTERIDAVLKILKKQSPLSIKQEKYCNNSCVERFLKLKGDSVKKAAKHLRAVLSWRENIGTDHLIADEFSSELAEGLAYVAGYDDDARPVLVFRIKQDYLKFHTQKSYLRLLVFTLEVAITTMSKFVEQFVLLYDASCFKSAPAFLNIYMVTLKVISEYYPGRLHRSFVVDPPSIFSCLWKGSRPFVEQWTATTVVSSLSVGDEEFRRQDDRAESNILFSYPHRTTSLRFDSSPAIAKSKGAAAGGGGGSASSRGFAFTVSHLDSLKPWYLSSVAPVPAPAGRPTSSSPSILAPNARSFSFASPAARSTVTPTRCTPTAQLRQPRTPMPSFLQSPFGFGKKEKESSSSSSRGNRDSFMMYYMRFYARPYDEMVYRSRMRPPLGGLLSIVSPHLLEQRRQHRHRHQHRQRS